MMWDPCWIATRVLYRDNQIQRSETDKELDLWESYGVCGWFECEWIEMRFGVVGLGEVDNF